MSEDYKELVLRQRLTELLRKTHNYSCIPYVKYFKGARLRRAYMIVLNQYRSSPYYLKKNLKKGVVFYGFNSFNR